MNYNNKRGQAAMEFLMTYGWAILAAIVVIAVLAIYFRPSNLVGQTSVMSAPFTALSQTIDGSTEDAIIEIRNSGAEVINIAAVTSLVVTVKSPSSTCGTTSLSATLGGSAITYPYVWTPGTTVFLNCLDVASGLDAGKTFTADLDITYTSGDGSLNKTSSGSIGGKIDA